MDFNQFLTGLFTRVGGYRPNEYNAAALNFIRKGASLPDLESKLPEALAKMEAQAKALNERGVDDGFRVICVVGELLMPAAVKQLFYAQKRQERMQNPLVSAMTGGMSDVWDEELADANPDSRSGDAEREEIEREEYPGTQDDEILYGRDPAKDVLEIEEHVNDLFELLQPFCLRADAVANSWRPDYGDRPALPFFVGYDSVTGENHYADNLNSALNELARVDGERSVQRVARNRVMASKAADAWS